VVITSYEKIKQGLGEKLQKPGVIDRDALGSWLKEAKLDGAGGPKVEFRPVEGCSTEELSKVRSEGFRRFWIPGTWKVVLGGLHVWKGSGGFDFQGLPLCEPGGGRTKTETLQRSDMLRLVLDR
jgi:hypothetical protein